MSANNEKCLIVGSGQVGKVLFESLKKEFELFEHDINPVKKRNKKTKNYQFVEIQADPEIVNGAYMHICFPYQDEFVQIVQQYYKTYNPKLVVIHSCLKPGTTLELVAKGIPAVHTPTIFDDNNFQSMPAFRKIVGYDKTDLALAAEKHLKLCFNITLMEKSYNSELIDILFNLYHMTCRSITFEMAAICNILGTDYKNLMELVHYNNLGYAKFNKPYMLLLNMNPDLNKQDFRTKLLDLLPGDMQSLFFKLAMKSYGLEQQEKQKKKEITNAELEQVQE